jgi:hypothetical protein
MQLPPNHSTARARSFWDRLVRGAPPALDPQPTVRLELIGREHAGKTALYTAFMKGPLKGTQPSGLQLGAKDPRVMTQWVHKALQAYQDLGQRGLLSTLVPEVVEYYLCRGDDVTLLFQVREVVGQILSHTKLDSPPEEQAKYEEYVANLTQADVLWLILPIPPRGTPADLDRYEADLQILVSYLRAALRLRQTERPCSVALVLTKLDTVTASEAEAREAFTEDSLVEALEPLVQVVTASRRVGEAMIVPVSAFGFGTAVVQADNAAKGKLSAADTNPRWSSSLSQGEPEWILRPGLSPQPFNLTPLVWWTLLTGLIHKEVAAAEGEKPELYTVASSLRDDLRAMNGWWVPLVGCVRG